jgi:hypothetical protein
MYSSASLDSGVSEYLTRLVAVLGESNDDPWRMLESKCYGTQSATIRGVEAFDVYVCLSVTYDTTAPRGSVARWQSSSTRISWVLRQCLNHHSCCTHPVDSLVDRIGHVGGHEHLVAQFWGDLGDVSADKSGAINVSLAPGHEFVGFPACFMASGKCRVVR